MTSNGVESAVRTRRFRWSLRTLFIAVTLISALLAVVAVLLRPDPTVFNDPRILDVVGDADLIEVFRLGDWPDVSWEEAVARHDAYPVVSRPVKVKESDWLRVRKLVLDGATYDTRGIPATVMVNGHRYRVRVKAGSDTLDYDICDSHVEVFLNGFEIQFAMWTDFGENALTKELEGILERADNGH